MIDQFSFERIHVHLVKFFDSLLQTPDIKIVKAALPESAERIAAAGKWQTILSSRVALLSVQAAQNALLQDLNHSGRRAFGPLAYEQMDVLRHHDVANQGEFVVVARLAKNLDKRISRANGAQQRKAPVARKVTKVKVPALIMANKFESHRKKAELKPGRAKIQKSKKPVPRG